MPRYWAMSLNSGKVGELALAFRSAQLVRSCTKRASAGNSSEARCVPQGDFEPAHEYQKPSTGDMSSARVAVAERAPVAGSWARLVTNIAAGIDSVELTMKNLPSI